MLQGAKKIVTKSGANVAIEKRHSFTKTIINAISFKEISLEFSTSSE